MKFSCWKKVTDKEKTLKNCFNFIFRLPQKKTEIKLKQFLKLDTQLHLQVRFPISRYLIIARTNRLPILINRLSEFGKKHEVLTQIISQMSGVTEPLP